MLRRGKGLAWSAGLAALACLCLAAAAGGAAAQDAASRQAHRYGRAAGHPAYLWLWFADGQSKQPEDGPYCAGLPPPPAFTCTYGTSIDDCQRQVLDDLNGYYADFNLVFTLSRPPTGDFYVIMITSSGAWCDQNSTEAGVAPFNCNDNPGLAGFAFECGKNAHACATLIAHEHGHLVGLEHTLSPTDIMNQAVLATASGFDDQPNRTVDTLCQGTQNSYQEMLSALGPWPGGAKPNPFAAKTDAGVTDASPDAGRADTADAAEDSAANLPAGIDTGPIVPLPGFDAVPRPPLPTVDAAGGGGSSHGGCSVAGRTAPNAAAIIALLGGLAAAVTRRGRRARPANARPPCAAPPR